jgi:membrane-bound ClpP family serine protease
MTGVAASELAPSGMVHVNGEDWSAVSDSGETIEKGARILVIDVEGLTIKVFKAAE